MSDILAQTLALPCGVTLPNRIAKAAMTEGLATFGVQFWFYAQLDTQGREGRAAPDMSVFAATRLVMSLQKKLLSGR